LFAQTHFRLRQVRSNGFDKPKTISFGPLLAALIWFVGWTAFAANMMPIAVTGFNRDMVVESSASGPPYTNALEFNPGENTAFYQAGLSGKTYGLPGSASFTSALGDGTEFQFQAYTGPNALVLSSETDLDSGTLTLVTPGIYKRIAILANSANGGGLPTMTLLFSDGSTIITNYSALDWFFNSGFALQGVDRINLTTGATTGGPNDPRFYQTTIDLGALFGSANLPLMSITFNKVPGVGATAIYAISGEPDRSMSPVAVTGFNRDVVVENTSAGPPYTTALNFNSGEATAYYQSGLTGKTYGLPASGSFASALADGTVFQFQPYTSSNALVLSADTGVTNGTLTLVTPANFSRIAILANSGNGTNPIGIVTLRFDNNSTFITNYYAPNWFSDPTNVALQGTERITLSSGATSGATTNPRFHQTTIDLTAALGTNNRPLVSLKFDKPLAKSTGIYAISGDSNIVTAAVIANLPATNVQGTTATLRGQVVSSGGSVPIITIHYGPSDGGTNPLAWAQSVTLGVRSGVFTQDVVGLATNSTYYFTAKAVNTIGTTWAVPSQVFSTPAPVVATLSNLGASSLTVNMATLNAQVVATGGDAPSITLFYGNTDGGTNAGAWAQSVTLGVQGGLFNYRISGLSSNTTYYYTVRGANLGGIAWAETSQSFATPGTVPPPAVVLSQHNDHNSSGANLNEWILNVDNVNSNQFGLLYSRSVDDQIYAQPLIVTNVNVPGHGPRNLLLVATVNDSVYAFDAEDAAITAPYWQVSFTNANAVAPRNSDMTGACGGNYKDFSGNIGIVGTPVIDPVAETIYFVARTKEFGSTYVQRLHALDITTGAERSNSPVVITATYPGTGAGSVGGVITFDPQKQNQRSGLTLVNGRVYIAWASHCDWGPYHGWFMAYDATTLQRVATTMTTATGANGGIWMSGAAPSSDEVGNIYLTVGNGTVGTAANRSDPINRGESFLKLNGTNLTIQSWFTPFNWQILENGDIDLGSAGILLIPGTTLALSGGKEGKLYLVDRDNMGGLSGSATADTNILQSFQVTGLSNPNDIHGAPVWWDGPEGSYTYVWGESDYLRQFKFNRTTGLFALPRLAQSPLPAPNGMPGGMLSVSANSTNAGSGILWASHQYSGDANQQVRPGILHAYDAQNVSRELWNSEQFSSRDSVGNFAKFVPPTVANGKVFLATFSNRLNVYGLLPRPSLAVAFVDGNLLISWPTNLFSGYTLQSAETLSPANWVNDNSPIVRSNEVFTVTKPATNPATFYRLKF
jgi:hypothetical protein